MEISGTSRPTMRLIPTLRLLINILDIGGRSQKKVRLLHPSVVLSNCFASPGIAMC
jgi:hypothetical protein